MLLIMFEYEDRREFFPREDEEARGVMIAGNETVAGLEADHPTTALLSSCTEEQICTVGNMLNERQECIRLVKNARPKTWDELMALFDARILVGFDEANREVRVQMDRIFEKYHKDGWVLDVDTIRALTGPLGWSHDGEYWYYWKVDA